MTVGDEVRRDIERDLHDGAQQRLVALRIELALESEQLEAEDPQTARLECPQCAARHDEAARRRMIAAGRWRPTATPIDAGARGFVVKDAPAARLALAIREVHRGGTVVDPALAVASLSTGASPLTERERDVLRAGRDGATVAEIAARLVLSEGTVRNYLSSAIGKTGARNRTEAALIAHDRGWL